MRGQCVATRAGGLPPAPLTPKEHTLSTAKFPAAGHWAVALFAAAALAATAAHGQAEKKDGGFQPQVGQAGKDVIWVPTPDDLVERMLRMAQTTSNDFVVDLGSGDGRTVIAAAKRFGARSMGIEYNPDMVDLSTRNAAKEGVTAKAKFVRGDIFETDFTQATVVTMYLLPGLNVKLRPRILDMKPGTRVVSHQFNMEDWQPDETTNLDGRRAYFWLVPAKVHGNWRVQSGADAWDLALEQKYQMLEGSVKFGAINAGLRDTRLQGEKISFAFVDGAGVKREFNGRVTGNAMEGTVKADNGPEARWTAAKR
jgi:SAM-dependent methyltransferase